MKTENTVMHKDFRVPLTEDQYEKVLLNDQVAVGLVRRANDLDLKAIAEKVAK